ncbi:MAG: hypothetical protein AUK47_07330 [Deltaproteobacteria bacterium CG2_30_63_29]|nr:MAG: hypothetical protein AUK47_07330 [Deltaproteobacteria bacterium CG2_30_63_29]
MNLPTFSVKRGVTVGMATLIVVGFGLFSLTQLKTDLYPDLAFPTVMVVTNFTGASPKDIETLVTRPLEGGLATVEAVETITSESRSGSSMIRVEFDWSADMNQAETDVRRALDLVEARLPDDATKPLVFALDPSMQAVVTLMVSGPFSQAELRRLAEDDIKPRLERLEGIANVEVAGGLERQIQVSVNPEQVQAFGLDLDAVLGALYQENTQEPGGSIQDGSRRFDIDTRGQYESVAQLEQVVVGQRQGEAGPEPLKLGQLARVDDTFKERSRILETDGQPAVMLYVRKATDANTVDAAEAVMAALPGIETAVGGGLQFDVVINQADTVNASISNLGSTALLAVVITFLVLLLFLRSFRSSFVVASALPVSVVATFALMDQASMTLNIISMAGLALAIGMLVDNAIVVLENIVRLRDEGLPLRDAAIQGAAEVSGAVTASTLTTVSVFVPILFVPGIAGVMFRDMAITICFALGVSLAVALTFVPLAASRLMKRHGVLGEQAPSRIKESWLVRVYGFLLDWTLDHRWVVGGGLLLASVGAVFAAGSMPTDFMAKPDQSRVEIVLETEVGSSLEETQRAVEEANQLLVALVSDDERRLVAMDLGADEGLAAVFSGGQNSATLTVPLVPMNARDRSQAEIEQALRVGLADVPGVRASIKARGPTGAAGDIVVELIGHDLVAARRLGGQLQTQLEALPQVAEVSFSLEDQAPQVEVEFDREKMAEMGLSTASVGRTISTAFKGRLAGQYTENGDEFDILVRYEASSRDEVEELRRLPIATPSGTFVPLSSFAKVEESLGPASIARKDQERLTELAITLKDEWVGDDGLVHRKDLGVAISDVEAVIAAADLPEGFSTSISGSAEDFKTSFFYLGLAVIVAIFLVYMVMAGQFESFRQPFIILFTVPLAGIGVVWMFALTGAVMDITALIGVVMLVGIVVNNGIVLVDAANRYREQGLDKVEAISTAARTRLRPVLLTSLTTILSMVPLALEIGEGAEMWSGMAIAVIGGLLASTALTLVVVPSMYTVFAGKAKTHDLAVDHEPQAA